MQAPTGVHRVSLGAQVVSVQLLPALGPEGVHEATPVGPVFTGVQTVAV